MNNNLNNTGYNEMNTTTFQDYVVIIRIHLENNFFTLSGFILSIYTRITFRQSINLQYNEIREKPAQIHYGFFRK